MLSIVANTKLNSVSMNKGSLLRFDWRLQTQSNKSLTLSDRACTLIHFMALGINSKIMSKKAEKFIEKYTTKNQNDWLVQKKDIIAKFMESYHNEQLRIANYEDILQIKKALERM